jgi:hypothetical protein
MTAYQAGRLIRLHQRAEHHANEYKRLSVDSSSAKATEHLRKVEKLFSQIRDIIRKTEENTSTAAPI